MSKRFVDMYTRTHTGFVWNSPFVNPERLHPDEPPEAENDYSLRRHDGELDELLTNLRRPRPGDYERRRLQQKMEYDLQLLHSLLGRGSRIEARSRDFKNPEYYIHINGRDLREILWVVAGNTSSPQKPHTFQEYNDGRFILHLNAPKRTIFFTPSNENVYIITLK